MRKHGQLWRTLLLVLWTKKRDNRSLFIFGWLCPTGPFTSFQPQNQEIDWFHMVSSTQCDGFWSSKPDRPFHNIKALRYELLNCEMISREVVLKLWKSQSGKFFFSIDRVFYSTWSMRGLVVTSRGKFRKSSSRRHLVKNEQTTAISKLDK